MKLKEKMDREMNMRPNVAGTLTPTRSEILPPKGAMIITVKDTGKISIPTLEGEWFRIS